MSLTDQDHYFKLKGFNIMRILYPLTMILILLATSVVYADGQRRSESCPFESAETLDVIRVFLEKVEKYPEVQVPEAVVQAIIDGVDPLTSRRFYDICNRLNAMHEEDFLSVKWPDRRTGLESDYIRYESAYYQAGEYYLAVFRPTPPPQPERSDRVSATSTSDELIIYDKNLNRIAGYSL